MPLLQIGGGGRKWVMLCYRSGHLKQQPEVQYMIIAGQIEYKITKN